MPDDPQGFAVAGSRNLGASGFSAEWLALREPADARARNADLSARLVQLTHRAPPGSPTRFIDLACGTGANLRYVAPRIGADQHWLLVDHDSALLATACDAEHVVAIAACRVETRRLDLTTELHALDFAPGVVVTASALLDLVSDDWLAQLVEHCRTNRCTALFALSYDGCIRFTPSDPDDEWIRQLVNRHQLGDKGFGPALGPAASQRACELFSETGFHVRTARSDWNLLPTERWLQQALLEGWAGAATELAPNEADRCKRWLTRRLAHVASGTSHILVGHQDLLAWHREGEET